MRYLLPISAAASFYVIPAIIGTGISKLFKTQEKKSDIIQTIINGFINFATGSLVLYIQIALGNFLFPSNLKSIVMGVVGFDILLSLTIIVRDILKNKELVARKLRIKDVLIIALLLIVATAAYGVWRLDSPTFTTLNWDIYHHQTLVNLIGNGKFKIAISDLSDSFQFSGYTTIFHTLLAIPQSLFNVDVLEFWWFVEYYHLLSVALISFSVTYAITKKRVVGLLGGLLGILIFESSMAYTSLFLLPQNLVSVVTGAFLANLIKTFPRNKRELIYNSIIFVGFVLLGHTIIGSLSVFLYCTSLIFLYSRKIKENKKIQYILLGASFILIPVVYIVTSKIDFNSINRGEAIYYNKNIMEKFELMREFYGYSLLAFLPLGYFCALKKYRKNYLLAVILNNGVLALTLSPIPYILKVCNVGRLTTHSLMAMGIWFLIKPLSRLLKGLSIIILTLSLGAIFIVNISMYKGVPSYKIFSTHVTTNEIEAAKFLKENYEGKNVLLVGEPATMHILEGLSGVNSPGGAYASLKTREILTDIYLTRDENIGRKLFEIEDSVVKEVPDKVLLAVGGRFRKWQLGPDEYRYGIYWNVWRPYDLEPGEFEEYDYIYYLREFSDFKEVFRNKGMVIFEVENEYKPF